MGSELEDLEENVEQRGKHVTEYKCRRIQERIFTYKGKCNAIEIFFQRFSAFTKQHSNKKKCIQASPYYYEKILNNLISRG